LQLRGDVPARLVHEQNDVRAGLDGERDLAAGESSRRWKVRWEVARCGSGVVASIAADEVAGVHAGLIHDNFSAHQGSRTMT
jgi:hypothetical protein